MAARTLTTAEVQHVAALARLALTHAEVDRMTRDLGKILEHIDELAKLDTSEVEPTTHAVDLAGGARPDEPRPSLSQDQALAAAPERFGEGFGVPKIIE